jgi:hypothetical protein
VADSTRWNQSSSVSIPEEYTQRNGGFPGLFKVQENGAQSLLCGIVIMFISPGSSCDMCLCLLSITSPSVIERRHVSKSLLHGCRHVTDLVLQVLV